MKRPAMVWTIFFSALFLALGVMFFFTVKMVDFELSIVREQARAALEETVRLALWRMDSTRRCCSILHPSHHCWQRILILSFQQKNVAQRFDPQVQQALSDNELNSRRGFQPAKTTDWHRFVPSLLDRISDILPGATLVESTVTEQNANDTRLLATIPARLVVPASALPDSTLPWNTPARISLMIAWICALLASASLAKLLAATISLSNRRGAFASAVTHELRTPLTTFRMYAEMLASRMVAVNQLGGSTWRRW